MSNPIVIRFAKFLTLPKHVNDADAFAKEYGRVCEPYTESEMEEAANIIIDTRKFRTWPTPAEVGEILKHVRRARHATAYLANQGERAATEQKRPVTQADRQFVIDCDEGRIDMGLCAPALKKLARTMRARGGY
jgi:hypothetical protein